ncbi:MAG TPA: hypothetical protein VFW33_08870 [Gemmataceae bacterium]|nr:hypothetical protein [Gemmataceae bacterium]
MHVKDFYLALILGIAIAHSTYDWTTALSARLPSSKILIPAPAQDGSHNPAGGSAFRR